MLDHRIKLSWSCHTNSEDIPEHEPLLPLLFPLPNLPRTLEKSRCIAISVDTSKDTATLQNLFATCPATSVLPHVAPASWGALEMGCIPPRQGRASPAALALCSVVLEGSARTRLSKTPTCAVSWCNLRSLLLQNPYAIICKLTEKPQTPLKKLAANSIFSRQSGGRLLPNC